MGEIAVYFLKLGCLGFGGPISLVAQMQRDLVDERRWLDKAQFSQSLALIKSMPGPLSFSTATYLGYCRGGFWGGTLAGWSLVLPAFCMILLVARFYDQVAGISLVHSALLGMQAGALALIAYSIKSLLHGYERSVLFWELFFASIGLIFWEVPEPLLILGFGAGVALLRDKSSSARLAAFAWPALFADEKIVKLFLLCFKSGAVVFGTGLAMVPILEHDFVTQMQWLSHSQFMDALAFGQLTPGPVLITVTFVGYKVAGLAGATVATLGIFFPSYIHMTTWFPRFNQWLSQQRWIANFILGALAAVVGTLVVTTFRLASTNSLVQNVLVAIFFGLVYRYKLSSWKVILLGALAGMSFL